MQKQRVVILGAGISGLSLAWYLSRSSLPLELVILEKTERAGGWVHTDDSTGFVFEKGPRAFKVSRSPATVSLLHELDLDKAIVWSEEKAHPRYLWLKNQLHRIPRGLFSLLFSPLMKGVWPVLFTEWKKAIKYGDETVWDFISRRFNEKVAQLFFDPMVVGIFGGDSRYISIRACFPTLKQWEEEHGSVLRGLWIALKAQEEGSKYSDVIPELPLSAMYSLHGGTEQLVRHLVEKLSVQIHYRTEVSAICPKAQGIDVIAGDQIFEADQVFCALPVAQTGFLLKPWVPSVAARLSEVKSRSIAVVNVGYVNSVLPIRGFGYLTGMHSQEDVLGVVFDSSIFPQHNERPKETRLTVKLSDRGLSRETMIEMALQGLKKHLKINAAPDAIAYQLAVNAIPQYGIDHLDKMEEIEEALNEELPQMHFVGNYWAGVAVDQCIARSKEVAEQFCRAFSARSRLIPKLAQEAAFWRD